jgi:hypothetical protein
MTSRTAISTSPAYSAGSLSSDTAISLQVPPTPPTPPSDYITPAPTSTHTAAILMASVASARVGVAEVESDYTLPALFMCVSLPFLIFGFWGLLKGDPAVDETAESSEQIRLSNASSGSGGFSRKPTEKPEET